MTRFDLTGRPLGMPGRELEAPWERRWTSDAENIGWLTNHTLDSRRNVTRKGFPDVVAVHTRHPWLLVIEDKADKGDITEEQCQWLRAIAHVLGLLIQGQGVATRAFAALEANRIVPPGAAWPGISAPEPARVLVDVWRPADGVFVSETLINGPPLDWSPADLERKLATIKRRPDPALRRAAAGALPHYRRRSSRSYRLPI